MTHSADSDPPVVQDDTARPPTNSQPTRAGGAAAAGGFNFQASVTAIAIVHIARGRPLGWLEGLVDDVPIALLVETGGAGDDLQVLCQSGSKIEAQIKRGLAAGERLWDTLLKLATAIHKGEIGFGVLIVCPRSSRSIIEHLASDIIRLGDGRSDVGDLARTLCSKLDQAGIPIQASCEKLRIVTVNALQNDHASIVAARSELEHICKDKSQVGKAWDRLYRDAAELIELRGRRTASSVFRLLRSAGIEIASDTLDGPAAVLSQLTDWTHRANSSFSIFGIDQALPIDSAWIPLKAVVRGRSDILVKDLSIAALRRLATL